MNETTMLCRGRDRLGLVDDVRNSLCRTGASWSGGRTGKSALLGRGHTFFQSLLSLWDGPKCINVSEDELPLLSLRCGFHSRRPGGLEGRARIEIALCLGIKCLVWAGGVCGESALTAYPQQLARQPEISRTKIMCDAVEGRRGLSTRRNGKLPMDCHCLDQLAGCGRLSAGVAPGDQVVESLLIWVEGPGARIYQRTERWELGAPFMCPPVIPRRFPGAIESIARCPNQ